MEGMKRINTRRKAWRLDGELRRVPSDLNIRLGGVLQGQVWWSCYGPSSTERFGSRGSFQDIKIFIAIAQYRHGRCFDADCIFAISITVRRFCATRVESMILVVLSICRLQNVPFGRQLGSLLRFPGPPSDGCFRSLWQFNRKPSFEWTWSDFVL